MAYVSGWPKLEHVELGKETHGTMNTTDSNKTYTEYFLPPKEGMIKGKFHRYVITTGFTNGYWQELFNLLGLIVHE